MDDIEINSSVYLNCIFVEGNGFFLFFFFFCIWYSTIRATHFITIFKAIHVLYKNSVAFLNICKDLLPFFNNSIVGMNVISTTERT